MTLTTETTTDGTRSLLRDEIEEQYRWDLTHIFADWTSWEEACSVVSNKIDEYSALRGTLASGADALLGVLQLGDELGKLVYRIWYYPSLTYDEDQRDNTINARRQEVQTLFARWETASAWFKPEILVLPWETLDEWMSETPELEHYRFLLSDIFRLAAHVLGEEAEDVLALSGRFAEVPDEAYAALSTADAKFPTITLEDGAETRLTYGNYRRILATNRRQTDRRQAFERFYELFEVNLNTYAALYHGVCQRDWFGARARRHATTLDAALAGNDIPTSVVEELIATTRAGVEPVQRYHRLRQRTLNLETYHLYDTSIPLIEVDQRYPYEEATRSVIRSVAPLGPEYQATVERAFAERWIDVYENEGKRSGAYSAGVYDVHPYMLLNYNETLDAVFTLAHEMGHSMHTILSHQHQPFTYARYTIFVAEVASTLNEALLLDTLLAESSSAQERVILLEHAIDSILGTFFTQVLFAHWELEAHRVVERGQPLTADTLSGLYSSIVREVYGDAVTHDDLYRITWARIPHFFQSPYYVYQYATSFAASAELAREIRAAGSDVERQGVVDRYLRLLRSGGSAHPVEQLREAGVDLTRPEPVQAVVSELDRLVTQLEAELDLLASA
jgi:oligoendopeptidase F